MHRETANRLRRFCVRPFFLARLIAGDWEREEIGEYTYRRMIRAMTCRFGAETVDEQGLLYKVLGDMRLTTKLGSPPAVDRPSQMSAMLGCWGQRSIGANGSKVKSACWVVDCKQWFIVLLRNWEPQRTIQQSSPSSLRHPNVEKCPSLKRVD